MSTDGDPLERVNNLVDLGEKTYKVLKPKFVRLSDPALDYLTSILDIISKMLEGMNLTITSYLSLSFDPLDKRSFEGLNRS